jgi:hypothetical protein
MEISQKCQGCSELNKLVNKRIPSFLDLLEQLTGETVASYGGNIDQSSIKGGMPEFATLKNGSSVDAALIEQAWIDSQASMANKIADISNLIDGCQGQELVVNSDGTEHRECGKLAVDAFLDNQN